MDDDSKTRAYEEHDGQMSFINNEYINTIITTYEANLKRKLGLKKFDVNKCNNKTPSIIILGKHCTGKSYLVKDLLFHQQNNPNPIPITTVISPTETTNEFYSSFIPKISIYDEYNPQIINNIISRQSIIRHKKQNNPNIDSRLCVVLDGCDYDSNIWKKDNNNNNNIKDLFMNNRGLNTKLIITFKFPSSIPPAIRCNIDYVFICRENMISNRKLIWKQYIESMFTYNFPFELFCQAMEQYTNDWGCLVIDYINSKNASKLEDIIFYYKA